MALDPRAQEFLQMMASAGLPPMHTLTAAQAREQSKAGRANIPPGPDVHRVEDRAIPGPAGEIPVRIYWPVDAPNLPLLVWYHGGGWVLGDLEMADPTCRRLATAAECIVMSVDYRLAPEHPAPAAHDDCYAALVWAGEHAAEVGADPTRIAVGGDSAGGNLAAVVAQFARDQGGPELAHQLLVYPVTDCCLDTRSYETNAEGYMLTREMMQWFWDCYAPPGADDVDRAAPCISPLHASDFAGLPPAYVLTAEYDPLCDEGEAYADRLRAAGVPVRVDRYAGQIHGFFGAAHFFPEGERAVNEAAAELRKAFAAERVRT